MPLLRWGLIAGALTSVVASAASYLAGYAMEMSLLRGLLAFPPVAFTAFFAELVVSTAPPGGLGSAVTADELSAERHPLDLVPAGEQRAASIGRRAAQA